MRHTDHLGRRRRGQRDPPGTAARARHRADVPGPLLAGGDRCPGAYAALAAADRNDLAEKFFNDAYWFDQLGCSSPRLLAWVGDAGASAAEDLAGDFHGRVRAVIERKGYAVDTSAAIAKLGQSMRSIIDDDVVGYHRYDNTLTVIDVAEFPDARGEFCGAGLFFQLHLDSLVHLAPHVQRQDQTLSHFGLGPDELRVFAEQLCGRGIDRIVPMGQALAFDRIWDGYDILAGVGSEGRGSTNLIHET